MRISFRLVMAWLVALSFACTDHGTGPATSTDASIALRPSFSTAGAAQEGRAIHRIRLEARAEGTTDVLLRAVVDVDPNATSWSVPLDVPFVPGRRIVVSIELIHVAADGSESVEWSGVTAPISLTAGTTSENAVTVFPGPLDNLQVTSLTLQESPTEMVEGDVVLLSAVVGAPAGLAPRVVWTTTNPDVMSVDATGTVRALLPGTTRIIAQAGPFADTAIINVRARVSSIEVTPASLLLDHIGAESLLSGRVLDARGQQVPGTTVEWSVSDATVLQHLGGGSVRALAAGTATVTATSPQAPGLTGAASIEVMQRPVAISVSPDIVVLNALGATAPLSAVVEDAGGTAIAGIVIAWSSTDPDIATVSADGVVTAVADGTTVITASAAGLSATTQLTVARTPSRLVIIAGDGQTAVVGAAVAIAPAVRVEDANGHALAGIEIGFGVVAGGGTVAVASASSDAGGLASAGGWTLGTTAGEQRMTATASGVTPLTFTATALAGAPAAIAGVAGDGQTARAGAVVPVAPAVRVTDVHGNPVAAVTVAFTTSGNGSITPAAVETDQAGIASATSWQLGSVAGTYTAQATATGVGTVVFTATAEAGVAAGLEIVAGDGQTAAAGSALPVAPAVRALDAHGNGVAGVTVSFTASGGAISPATVVTDAAGIATAASWQLGTVVGAYNVQASADGVAGVTFTATAVAGAPGNLAIIAGDGQTAGVGTAVEVAPAVRVTDVHGNAVPGATVAFVVGTGGGTVAPASVVTDASGAAAVTSWTLGAEPGENTLTASVGELVVTLTATAEVMHGEPAILIISTGNGQSAPAGSAVETAPAVMVLDEFEQAVPGVTVTFAVASGGGSVTGETAVTDANGLAALGSWTLGTTAGENTLTATAGELTVTFTATAVAGAPAAITAYAGDGQSAAAGTALPIAPAARVADANGNSVAGVTVTFAVASGGGSVTGENAVTDADGLATVGSWTLGTTAGENTLNATAGALAVTFTATAVIEVDPCAPIAITVGTATQAELSTAGCVVEGVPIANFSLELAAQTAFSMDVAGSPAFQASINGAEGVVYALPVDAAAGFSAVLVLPAGSYSMNLVYTGGDQGTVTVGTTPGLPAACAQIVTARGVAIANTLSTTDCAADGELLQYLDTYVLIVPPGQTTQWSVAADMPVLMAVASEMSDGLIAFTAEPTIDPVLTLTNSSEGPLAYIVQVIAGADEVTGAYTLSILDVEPPAALAASAGGDAQSADAGQAVAVPPAVIVRDAGNVPVAGVPVTFTIASGGGTITGGTPASATSNVVYTNRDGVAALDEWTLGATPGPNSVVAAVSGVTGTVTFTATGESAEPVMAIDLLDRTFVGVSFTAPLRVTINQPAPAGGLVVSVFSDDMSRLTVASPGTITIPEGATSGTITVNGVDAGLAPVRAVAAGFPDAAASIQVSLRLISLPTTLNVPFGHNASLPVQLAEPAPAGGTVVTLTSSDPSRVEVLTPTVTVLAGATTANAVVYGALPGPATLSATAVEYIAGSSAATTRAELELRNSTGSTSLTINQTFGGSLRLRLRSAGSDIAAPSPGVSVTLTAADPTCVAVPSSVVIPTGLTQINIDVAYGGSATTPCTTMVTATGANLVASDMSVRVDPTPIINMSGTQIGSGLQRSFNGYLGASNHGGVTVRITSADPTKLLIAPDGNTPGSAFLDIPVSAGNTGFGFWLQGIEGVVADVNVTVTATGFTDRTALFNVQQPALQLSGLTTNTTTLAGDDALRVQIGLPYAGNSSLWQSMAVRAGAPPLVATVTTGNTEVGRLITTTDDAASVTVEIPAGASISASSVAAGGAALRPIGEGVTTVAATIPGFIATTAASAAVTVTQPIINMSGTQIGSGLQRSWNGYLGATNHGGVTVRITSADPTKLLIAPDDNTVGGAFLDVPLADGNTGFGFWLQGIEGVVADVAVTVTVPGFADRTVTFNVQQPALQLTGVNTGTTTLTGDDAFRVQIGLPYAGNSGLWQSMVLRAGAPALVATVTTSAPAVGTLLTGTTTAASATVEIPAGTSISASSVATGGIALRPAGEGQTTVAASIPGYIATTAASSLVTVTSASINLSGTEIGSGLQRSWSGSLGAAGHGGVTVRITSADPAKLLIAPDANTVGSAFLDIPVANGNTGFGFWVQGIEDVVADVNVTASATGFNDRTVVFNVQQPALQLSGLNSSTTTLSGDDPFRVQIGLPYSNNSGLWQSQVVRAGAQPVSITVTGTTTAGQLTTATTSGGSATIQIPAGSSISASSVAGGGVALRPLTAGTTVISAAATGYITTTAGSQTVTITAPAINLNGTTIGAGLQRSWSGSLGASNHSGVTVRLTSSNAAFVVLAPDGGTVGTGTLDVVVPAGQTGFNFWLQGIEGATGSISVMATASGFTDGSGTIEVVQPAFQLSGLLASSNTAAVDDAFRVQVGLPYDNHSGLWQSMAVRAGSSLTASVTSSDEAVGTLVTTAATARTVTVTIAAGQSLSASSVATGGVAFRPLTAGATTVSTAIPGLIATDNASGTVNVAAASISVGAVAVGAGLQAQASAFLSGPNHGGVTIRLTSSDPTRLLFAPDANTAGASFIDVNVANGTTGVSFFVQGMEGTTGNVAVTASAAGFTDGAVSHSVMQSAVEIIDLATSMPASAADDPFRVRVGIPNSVNSGMSQYQNVRAGGGLSATVTSDAGAVGQLVTQAVTGASVSVNIAGSANTSPITVATGGVAFDPQMAGTVNVAVSIPNFVQLPSATRTITISP